MLTSTNGSPPEAWRSVRPRLPPGGAVRRSGRSVPATAAPWFSSRCGMHRPSARWRVRCLTTGSRAGSCSRARARSSAACGPRSRRCGNSGRRRAESPTAGSVLPHLRGNAMGTMGRMDTVVRVVVISEEFVWMANNLATKSGRMRPGELHIRRTNMNTATDQGIVARRKVHMTLRVNGEDIEVSFAPYKTLLEVLREDAGLTGTKHGCELGECGACAVLVDGESLLSRLALAVEFEGRSIETVEGLASGTQLHPLQAAFADLGGSQCGYCTSGFMMTAKALLDHEPNPSREHIKEALSGNICRCTGYQQIFESVEEAARVINTRKAGS